MLTNLAKLLGLMLDCCCQIDTCLIFFRHLQNTLLAFCILNDTCLIILTDAVTIPNAYILYNYESCKKGHRSDSVPLFGMYHSNLRKFYKSFISISFFYSRCKQKNCLNVLANDMTKIFWGFLRKTTDLRVQPKDGHCDYLGELLDICSQQSRIKKF